MIFVIVVICITTRAELYSYAGSFISFKLTEIIYIRASPRLLIFDKIDMIMKFDFNHYNPN